MSLQWNAPLQPDYVITAYTLHHRVPILKSQSEMWAPPSMATVQFHTYNPSGILFYQINSTSLTDNGLNPFSEYLYSVTSLNSAGSADSSWSLTPGGRYMYISSITVTGGLSSPAGGPQTMIFNVQAGATDDTSDCCDRFATTASTVGGQGVGPPAAISTLKFVPIGVQSPVVVSEGTHFLHLEWLPPAQPNGATVVYSGANLQATVTGLSPATLNFFSLVAYDAGGSTQSNASSVTTIESSPDGVPFPNVTIINATALAIVWSTPLVPNGIGTYYVVLQTNIPSGFSYVSTDLQPFTAYSCSILACTHWMDLMLCRCRMWAPPTSLCLGTCQLTVPPVHDPAGTALHQLERRCWGVIRAACQPAQHEDSPPEGPPDPESDTDDSVISVFINKIINPDKSFGS
eukprot:Em0009g673a